MAQLGALVLQRDDQLINDFVEGLGALSERRAKKYRIILRKVSKKLGPFEEVKYQDLKRYVEELNSSQLMEWTKRDYRLVLKRFFSWLRGKEFASFIKLGEVKSRIGPEDVLNDVELNLMRHACTNLRDKALVEALYETACRPHEFLALRKGDVSFDDYGAIVYVRKGKTGPRRIRVVNAAPLLANWIENHPLKSKDAPLWVDLSSNTKYEPLKWIGLKRLLRRMAKRANVHKKVNPYIFRHTRLTHLARFMTEAQLCEFAGWEQGSDMPAMYVHLSGRDVDDALLKAYGIKKEETLISKAPKKCVRCGAMCEASAELCNKCGMALTLQAALKKDEELRKLREEVEALKKDAEEFRYIISLTRKYGKVEVLSKDAKR